LKGVTPSIAVTAGEPAGIGPDLVISLAERDWPAAITVIADPDLLRERAERLGAKISIDTAVANKLTSLSPAGHLRVLPVRLGAPSAPGVLQTQNSGYVIETIARACDGCLDGTFDAMVTAPVHKGIINDNGTAFSGHTEFLANRCGAERPVMLLVAGELRVALVTTHLALRDVADAIRPAALEQTLRILDNGLRHAFGIHEPAITVLGLNPHAGESGHLGHEDRDIIAPAVEKLRCEGLRVRGPLPADTAFTPARLAETDAVLAMYHDQGLPVIKNRGFGRCVNVTLGLPIIRTSVDHGTALELAGTGGADAGSLMAAVTLAIEHGSRRHG